MGNSDDGSPQRLLLSMHYAWGRYLDVIAECYWWQWPDADFIVESHTLRPYYFVLTGVGLIRSLDSILGFAADFVHA